MVCQLLRRAGRWRDGAFHPAGPRAAGLEASVLAGSLPARPGIGMGDVAAFFPMFWVNKNIVTPKIPRLWDLLVKFLLLFLGVTFGRI